MEGEIPNNSSRRGERKSKYRSKKTNEDKYIVKVYLPKRVYDKLNEIAQKMYPDIMRGRLSYVIIDAIEFYYTWHSQRHAKINPRGSTVEAYRQVLRIIEMENDGVIPRIIPNVLFWRFVSKALDIRDPRSIRNWIRRFAIEGLIKPLSQDPINYKRLKEDWRFSWEIVAVKV